MRRSILLSSAFMLSLGVFGGVSYAHSVNIPGNSSVDTLPAHMISVGGTLPKQFLDAPVATKVKAPHTAHDHMKLADETIHNPALNGMAPSATARPAKPNNPEGYNDKNGYYRPGSQPDDSSSTPGMTGTIASGAVDTNGNSQQVVLGSNTGDGSQGESDIQEDISGPQQDEIERRSFEKAMKNMFTPKDIIRKVKARESEDQQVRNEPVFDVQPIIRSVSMTLRPNEQPPVIHLQYGDMTALTFADVTGAPWYISRVDTDENAYSVPDHDSSSSTKSNILTLAPKTRFSKGRNLIVYLEHSAVPVILSLDTGYSPKVDFRVDVAVMKRGPNARSDFSMEGLSATNDDVMQAFIDGLPPEHAKKLKTTSPQVEAWKFNHLTYIRTNLSMKSPMWRAHSNSNISGIRVYVVADNISNIIVSDNGRLNPVMLGN